MLAMNDLIREWKDLYRFIGTLLIPLTVVGVLIFIVIIGSTKPDSYAASFSQKEELLINTTTPRLIIMGGSGAAAGIDSVKLGEVTGLAPVNMGVYAGSGMRLIVNDVLPHLRRGDVVILAPEYEMLQQPSYGDGSHLLQILHANPSKIFDIITPRGLVVMTRAFPSVLQQETHRLLQNLRVRDTHGETTLSERLYSIQNITPTGDLDTAVAGDYHLGREQLLREGDDFVRASIEPANLALITRLKEEAEKVGASMYVVLPAVPTSVSEGNTPSIISQYEELLLAIGEESVIGRPGYFVFSDTQFLDSIGHLTVEGRKIRTQLIADQLATMLR